MVRDFLDSEAKKIVLDIGQELNKKETNKMPS